MTEAMKVVAERLDGMKVNKDGWKDDVIAAFQSEIEVIVSKTSGRNTYLVYENESDAPMIAIEVVSLNENEYLIGVVS